MRSRGNVLLALGVLLPLLASPEAQAQARQPLALSRVQYNTRKNIVKPEGELRARIDALERELTEASRLGRTGEVRRLLAKGMALLSGREWDRTLELSGSLVLRAEEGYVDSSRPWTVRLEQIYRPSIELGSPLSARASIHKPAGTGRGQQPGEKAADLASLESVGRDFLDEPLRIEADLSAVENGGYVLRVELLEKGEPLGSASLPIELYRGLHGRLRAIRAELDGIRGFEERRADALYPLDYVRRVNRGLIERGSFALAPELARAEGILGALQDEGYKGIEKISHAVSKVTPCLRRFSPAFLRSQTRLMPLKR